MKTFSEFYRNYKELINEKLITLGKSPYPKFNTVVIMAGGAGSGKGFIKNKLLGVEGLTFDVDALKQLSMRTPVIIQKAKDKTGVDIDKLDLKNPENTSLIHGIISDVLGLDKSKLNSMYLSILTAPNDRKPNLIFDVTLKDLYKLENLTRDIKKIGSSS